MTEAGGEADKVGVGERDQRRHDVFISYSSKNKTAADMVCTILEGQGVRCWMAPRDIIPGEDWAGAILDAIEETRAFVLIFSGFSNASPQVKREVERAANANKPIIPFRIEDVTPSRTLEFFISTPHWLDAITPPMEQHAKALAGDILRLLGDVPGGPLVMHEGPTSGRRPATAPDPALATKAPATSFPRAAAADPRPARTGPPSFSHPYLVTALALVAFLGASSLIHVTEGDAGIGIVMSMAPIFGVVLSLGLARGGWLGALGGVALTATSIGAWIAAYLIAWWVVTLVRHFPADRAPLQEAEYLLGGLVFGAVLAGGFFALLLLFGRRLATREGLRLALTHTIVLAVLFGAASGLLGLLRDGSGSEAPLWYRLGFPALWFVGMANGAFAVASGAGSPLFTAASARAYAMAQANRRAGALPRTAGWVVGVSGVVAAAIGVLGLMGGIQEARVPRGLVRDFGAGNGGGGNGGGVIVDGQTGGGGEVGGGKGEGEVIEDGGPQEAAPADSPPSQPPAAPPLGPATK